MKEVRLGLIGLGYMGKTHLRHSLRLDSAKLIAVADLSEKALNAARKMGVKNTFTDYHELLKEPNIDAVIIALPTFLHKPCVQSVAEAGKDIFVEKPLARNIREGKEIVSDVKANGVNLMVGYQMRFSDHFRCLKKKIEEGVLGDVEIAYGTNIGAGPFFHRAEFGIPKPVPNWWFQKELSGGGALMDLGCHLINLFRWYFGDVSTIQSYFGYRYDLDIEDQATCIVRFESGPKAIINVGWFSQESQQKVEVLGTLKHAIACRSPQNRIQAAVQMLATNSTRYEAPSVDEIRHFVHCVRNDLQPSPSGNEALKDLEVISLAYENDVSFKKND